MPLPTPAQTFAHIEQAHAAWTRGGATVAVSTTTSDHVAKATYRLDLDGAGGATLRIQNPAQGKLAATDQAFVLSGNRVLGVDFVAGESLIRPAPARGPLNLRLFAVLGGLDDAVGFLTSAAMRAKYLDPIKGLAGWKATPKGLVRRIAGARASTTEIDVDPSGRLRGLHVVLPGSRLDWSIAYRPYTPLSLPRALKRVDAFTARLRPPHYAGADAQRVVEGMLNAGGRLASAIVRIDKAATVWIDGSRIRYEGEGRGLAFDGRTLTLVTSGAVYQGRASRSSVIDYAASLLGSVDPLVRSFLVRTPPYAELFPSEARVRVVGTMASGGQPCDVIAVDGPRFRASVFVRKSDRLPLSVETEALDGRGNALTRTMRTLAWSSVGNPLPKVLFALRIPAGRTVLPLPKRRP